jgi:hypothetical protein
MTTTQRDEAKHSEGDRGRGCCGGHGHEEATGAARRRALEERHRDLEQKLADVTEQLADLPAEEPSASE